MCYIFVSEIFHNVIFCPLFPILLSVPLFYRTIYFLSIFSIYFRTLAKIWKKSKSFWVPKEKSKWSQKKIRKAWRRARRFWEPPRLACVVDSMIQLSFLFSKWLFLHLSKKIRKGIEGVKYVRYESMSFLSLYYGKILEM